jgi:ribosome-binding protein aMBF1 (putative translation factor)
MVAATRASQLYSKQRKPSGKSRARRCNMTSSPDRPDTLAAVIRDAAVRARISTRDLAAKTKLPEARLRAFWHDPGASPAAYFSLGEVVTLCEALDLDPRQLAIPTEVRVETLAPTFGTLLRQLMERAGLKQKDLARRLELPASTLSAIMSDQRTPTLEFALKVVQALECDLSVFANIRFAGSSE